VKWTKRWLKHGVMNNLNREVDKLNIKRKNLFLLTWLENSNNHLVIRIDLTKEFVIKEDQLQFKIKEMLMVQLNTQDKLQLKIKEMLIVQHKLQDKLQLKINNKKRVLHLLQAKLQLTFSKELMAQPLPQIKHLLKSLFSKIFQKLLQANPQKLKNLLLSLKTKRQRRRKPSLQKTSLLSTMRKVNYMLTQI